MLRERYVVKIGSAIVAHGDGRVRADRIAAVVDQVAALRHEGAQVAVVTSGAVAFGLKVGHLTRPPQSTAEMQAASAIGQGELYRAFADRFSHDGVPTAQVLLTFFDMSTRNHYVNARRTLRKLLRWGVVPIINENDTTSTHDMSFGDNDLLAAEVAILLNSDSLVLLTGTEGLFSDDPTINPQAHLIEEVGSRTELESLGIGSTKSGLGRGGMKSKAMAAEMAASAGIPAYVCSGEQEGTIAMALRGQLVCTMFRPQKRRRSSFKLWLHYVKRASGAVTIDAGAAKAIKEKGASLLPVGVQEIHGSFQTGDAIGLRYEGAWVGKGITNYSGDELHAVKGMRSAVVRRLLPHASDEVVHRDFLVVGDAWAGDADERLLAYD